MIEKTFQKQTLDFSEPLDISKLENPCKFYSSCGYSKDSYLCVNGNQLKCLVYQSKQK